MVVILRVVLGASTSKHEKMPIKRENVESGALECSYATLYNPNSKYAQAREAHASSTI